MPDVQEVFRMSTQKVRQDPGAMQRQLNRQRKAARNRKIGALTVVACIAAAIAVAALVSSRERGEIAPSIPAGSNEAGQMLSVVDVGSRTETGFTAPLGASDFDVSLDGSMVAYTDGDESGTTQVFMMDADGSNAKQLTHTDGSVTPRGLSWSSDGSMIAYERDTSDGSQIFVVGISDGLSTQVTTEPRGAVDPGGWAPDGTSLVFSSIDASGTYYTARLLDLTTGRSRLIAADGSTPTLSPDGARIAFTSWLKSRPRMILADSDGSGRRIIAQLDGDDGYQRWSPDSTQIAYIGSTDEHGFGTYVYDLATGETRFVTSGTIESWIDDDHILVS
jgi:Tol biopolymer transport system component